MKNKKLNIFFQIVIIVFTIISIANFNPIKTQAQSPNTYVFSELGWDDAILEGPLAEKTYRFNIPGHLEYSDKLILNIKSQLIIEENSSSKGFLSIYFNDELIELLVITSEKNNDFQLEIPLYILNNIKDDDLQSISFLYQNDDCDRDSTAVFLINNDSTINFQLEETKTQPNIKNFPSPFYVEDSLPTVVKTNLIVPNTPSELMLLSSMTIAAEFGNIFGGSDLFEVKTWGMVSELEKTNDHFIFIGFTDQLPEEIRIQKSGYITPPAQGNGVIFLTNSPWNQSRASLIISSDTEQGILNASKSLGNNELPIPYSGENKVVIDELNEDIAEYYYPNNQEITFDSFGYSDKTVSQIGLNWINYSFNIPTGYISTDQSELLLNYDYSSNMINTKSSSVNIRINGFLLDGIVFLDNETDGIQTSQISIPASYLIEGENILQLIVNLIPINVCMNEQNQNSIWFTLFNDSEAKIGLIESEIASSQPLIQDLQYYPEQLSRNKNLNPTIFLVSEDERIAKLNAVKIAYDLGNRYNNFNQNVEISFDQSQIIKDKQNIIIGIPSQIPLLNDFYQYLPIEFNQENEITRNKASTTYIPPVGVDLGFILIPMRNTTAEETPIFILGDSSYGLFNAGNSISKNSSDIYGNLSIVVEEENYSFNVSEKQELFSQENFNNENETTINQNNENIPVELSNLDNPISIEMPEPNLNINFSNPILIISLISFVLTISIIIFVNTKRKG